MWESKRTLRQRVEKLQQRLEDEMSWGVEQHQRLHAVTSGRLIDKLQRKLGRAKKANAVLHRENRKLRGLLKMTEDMPLPEGAERRPVLSISEAEFAADRSKYIQVAMRSHQVIVRDKAGAIALVLGIAGIPFPEEEAEWPEGAEQERPAGPWGRCGCPQCVAPAPGVIDRLEGSDPELIGALKDYRDAGGSVTRLTEAVRGLMTPASPAAEQEERERLGIVEAMLSDLRKFRAHVDPDRQIHQLEALARLLRSAPSGTRQSEEDVRELVDEFERAVRYQAVYVPSEPHDFTDRVDAARGALMAALRAVPSESEQEERRCTKCGFPMAKHPIEQDLRGPDGYLYCKGDNA